MAQPDLQRLRLRSGVGGSSHFLGVFLGSLQDGVPPPSRGVIERNSLLGGIDAIRISGSSATQGVADVQILHNRIEPLLQPTARSPQTAIRLEHTTGAVVAENLIRSAARGIIALSSTRLQVRGNDIANVSGPGIEVRGGLETTSLSHNRLAWCAYRADDGSVTAAVAVVMSSGDVRIESCEVIDTGLPSA